jgi:multiple sugar transport system ATP-binding protein
MATVDFEHVDKIYAGGNQAVSSVDLHVEDGELMVVVGPSGCGKSTLLRLLAGLEPVTRGAIRIGERVVNDLTPQERNIAMVFQDYALYPHRTVRGNLEFPLLMRKLPREEIEKRVEWAAELLSLTGNLDRFPKQLSGGERQRVAMGRALVREPTVFLLDEPLSNLDAKLRTEVRAEIADLQRRTGTTMFYVTHDQIEAMTLGHRVTVLDRGRVQQTATPREVYERPANVFVAGFIGNPPMNLFPTSLSVDERGRALLTIGDQSVPISPAGLSAETLRSLVGRRVTAGVRAEAVRLAGAAGEGSIGAVVEHVECLGHETLAAFRAAGAASHDGVRLIVRLPAIQDLAKGQAVRLEIDPKSVYLFDEEGRAL